MILRKRVAASATAVTVHRRIILPPLHSTGEAPDRAHEVLDRVRRRELTFKLLREAESLHGERLVESFFERGRRTWMLLAKPSHEAGQHRARAFDIGRGVRVAHRLPHRRAHVVGELVEHVARLVSLAALNDRALAEHVADSLRERLRAVDNHEHLAVGAESAIAQISEQRCARRCVLGRPLANAEHVLLSVGIDAERDEQHVVVDVHAVDHEHAQFEYTEIATEPLGHLSLGCRDEPPTHRTAARPARRQNRGQWLQRPRVATRRNADEHLLDRALVQRVLDPERGPRRQLHLVAVERADTRPLNLHTPPANHELARSRSRSPGLTGRQVRVPPPRDVGAFLFEHGDQRLGPRGDHERAKVLADEDPEFQCELSIGLVAREIAERRAELRSVFRWSCLPGSLLHGGLSGFEPRESSRGRFDRHLKFQQGSGLRRRNLSTSLRHRRASV